MPPAPKHKVRVGSTGNKPELLDTVPITKALGRQRRVVMSFGPGSRTDSPLPDVRPGDRLAVFAELEVTTDAEDPKHPGLIGNAYSYPPLVEARLLLAADDRATEEDPGRALALAKPWRQTVSHRHHHGVVVFPKGELTVPKRGLPWNGPSFVNLVVGASNAKAKRGDLLLIGQNEKTPVVVQDMAGIRVIRLRPAKQPDPQAIRDTSCRVSGIPVKKRETLAFSHRLDDLKQGEQLFVRAKLITDAAPLGYEARISTRMFLADSEAQLDPGGGDVAKVASWKGHLSKPTGFNCLPEEGERTTLKFGVLRVLESAGKPLFLNLVAVSSDPFGGAKPNDELPVITRGSFLELTRYPPEVEG
jgi:hypothetical protein